MSKKILDIDIFRNLHRQGDYFAAKEGYLKILKDHPQHKDALHLLGILYAQQEDYPNSIECLEKAVNLTPSDLSLNLHLANIYKLLGLFQKAQTLLEKLTYDHPDYVPAYNNLGTIYYSQGKLDDAIECYKKTIKQEPQYVDAYYNLGLAYYKKNKLSEAEDTFTKLLNLAPEHFAAKFHLACVKMQQDKIKEAIALFLQIEEVHANHFETETNLATCYLKHGALNEAKLHYFKALELVPDDPQVLFNIGVISMQQGYVDLAIQHYQRACRIQPDNFAIHNNLAVAFLAKQHAGYALQHFKEALRLSPSNKAIEHTIKVLSQTPEINAAPSEYVKSLFDSYADHYDMHLTEVLKYKIPQLFLNHLQNIQTIKEQHYSILDLGCGTGLCGSLFKKYAQKLVGVDLSTKMLDIARQKNIYDECFEEDIIEFLKKTHESFNLILAGDVVVYLGDLTALFQNITKTLTSKGYFIFNTEVSTSDDFKMSQSGRFLHSKPYIEKLTQEHQLTLRKCSEVETRLQNNEAALGYLYILQKN